MPIYCTECGSEITDNSYGEWFCMECGHDNTEEVLNESE